MIVISDSGPIISLAILDLLDVLEKLYGQVLIPEEVWREVSRHAAIPQVSSLVSQVRSLKGPNAFSGIMDSGEAEASALYLEMGADLLIVDDKDARRIAEANHIACIGTLAILTDARDAGLVPALKPLFQTLLSSNRYFKKQLLNRILTDYGETPLDDNMKQS
jgi:predicted nucleic acid-binding protein